MAQAAWADNMLDAHGVSPGVPGGQRLSADSKSGDGPRKKGHLPAHHTVGKKKGRFKDFHERERAWLKARRPMMEWLESKSDTDADVDPKDKLRNRCTQVFSEID